MRLLVAASALCMVATARSFTTTASVTSDNFYGIYTGTATSANALHGSDGNWATVETYSFTMTSADYLYVAVWGDDFSFQGFLGQFSNPNGRFYSHDPQWQVTATGVNLDLFSQLPSLAQMSTEILRANAGTNASGGWVNPTAGWTNSTGSQFGGRNNPWGQRVGIDAVAQWSWYDSGRDGTSYAPFHGFNHDEFLIYRIEGNAVPEPATVAAIATGLAGLLARRRRASRS